MSYADRDKYGMYKKYGDSADPGPGPVLMGAETLIGDSVVNGAEEDLGDIKEIMLDMNTGQVAYAVLAFGGFLGLGEKLFAVPWQALHLDTINKRFVLNVAKDRLQNAPGFNPDDWPDMSDVQWANQIHSFYGTDVARQGAPTMGPGTGMSMGSMGAGSVGMGAGMAGGMGAGSAGSSSVGAGTASSKDAGLSSGAGSSTTGAGGGTLGSGLASGDLTGGKTGLGAGTTPGSSERGSGSKGGGGSGL